MAADPALDAEALRAHVRALRAAVPALRALRPEARAEAIEHAARTLLDAGDPAGAALRAELCASTGLTPPVIEHGLRTTLALFDRDALLALLATAPRERAPAQLVTTVLAGNLFSAAARPLLLPLLCGSAVLAKASSSDDALPRALQAALVATDPRLGAACATITFAHADDALQHALLEDAELVSAYGSDETLAALAARLPRRARLLAHGHGLGAIVIGRDALSDEAAAAALAARAACDVAAYDQRGCLSPHFALVESGAAVSARAFAGLLADALETVEHTLPRGALAQHAAAAQLQWRGVAAAVGELVSTGRCAVSYEGARALRPSSGHRNLAVYDCTDLADARARLAAFGPHLKALGLAGTGAGLSNLAPYTCELGAMQTPPLTAHLDGLHPLAGF